MKPSMLDEIYKSLNRSGCENFGTDGYCEFFGIKKIGPVYSYVGMVPLIFSEKKVITTKKRFFGLKTETESLRVPLVSFSDIERKLSEVSSIPKPSGDREFLLTYQRPMGTAVVYLEPERVILLDPEKIGGAKESGRAVPVDEEVILFSDNPLGIEHSRLYLNEKYTDLRPTRKSDFLRKLNALT